VLVSAFGAQAFVVESKSEFLASGDFDGNGKPDVVVVEKKTGKYRVAYQQADASLKWVSVRKAGIANITGVAVGKLLRPHQEAIAFGSADLNQIHVIEAASLTTPGKPVVSQPSSLGPATMTAIDVGGEGNTPLHDLFVATIFNDPDPYMIGLVRAADGDFSALDDFPLQAEPARANAVQLKAGQPPLVALVLRGKEGDQFRLESLAEGKPQTALSAADLPMESEYVAAQFQAGALPQFLFHGVGATKIQVRTVNDAGGGKYELAAPRTFDLPDPIRQAWALPTDAGAQLLVIHGEGEKAVIYRFDGSSAPAPVQPLPAPANEYWSGAFPMTGGFILLSGPSGKAWSSRFHRFNRSGESYAAGASGDLPTLDETDVMIHARILANQAGITAADMKPYTNRIPGTAVTYVMLPIPGGEFIMGSPGDEAARKEDEGPQHKVKISPFWMGRCEVTWNEYELFMYPDEEKKFRATNPTDTAGDQIADVVARPTKPYTEMSFGMGKDGYPAIAMTQHGANKYCQWLSAKTGQFYRLPTEAEWEYACRAGTTTAYSFGDDVSKLPEFAWFEENSDFKYHKIGTKKPNPWGLHDMHGNVLEWCIDQYQANYSAFTDPVTVDPWTRATKPYPHAARGGSYDDEKSRLRTAARRASDRSWKMQDPQLPKSVWYFSDAPWVGFRVVRPLNIPPPEELSKYWTSGVERD
jgi:formylglycine-generating enzyme required for sulfatase activity